MIYRLRRSSDTWAVLTLMALWMLFFWRLFTPIDVDQLSLEEGDFSGQFVSWTSYSVERIQERELPLWNPYMNAGAPFLADPQTEVLYPPRLLTVSLLAMQSEVTGGDVYVALQTEMTLHVLLGMLLMYLFLRRVTRDMLQKAEFDSQAPSIIGSMMGALIFGFGGFMSAYPQLQLPVLETAIWIPLVLLGIHEATRPDYEQIGWRCVVLAGIAFGISVLAGHPQTTLFIGYIAVAYLIYRAWRMRAGWWTIVLAIVLFAIVAGGLSAVQWMPSLEFQRHTYRQDLTFDEKGGGFALQDPVQILFPALLGRWSPLYLGVLGVVLVVVAIWRRVTDYAFWGGVGIFALILSFGQKMALYSLVYILLPGFGFFRGQERAAFAVVTAAAVLAALGGTHFLTWDVLTDHKPARQFRRSLLAFAVVCALFSLIFFVLRLIPPNGELYQTALQSTIFALLMALGVFVIAPWVMRRPADSWRQVALVALLAFDLFSVNMGGAHYEPIPAKDRLPTPAYVDTIHANLAPGQHVEGLRGIQQSYGALYRLPDVWGNSPLRLDSMEFYLWNIPIERRWELLAVQVVNSEWDNLPVPHTWVGSGIDDDGQFNIYRLDDPRSFAHMVFQVQVADNQEQTRAWVADPEFPLRDVMILTDDPGGPVEAGESQTTIIQFEPEYIEIAVQSDNPGILSLALPYVPGWQAEIDGEDAKILEAYGGLSAVYIGSGTHTVILKYRPRTVQAGGLLSILTLIGIVGSLVIRRRTTEEEQDAA